MKMLIKTMRIMIGIFVLILLAMINNNFGQFLIMSILCTAGASLVVWLPIAWVIGAVCLAFFPIKNEEGKEELTLSEIMHSEYMALNNFYTDAKAKGLSTEEIQKKLIEAGWTEEQIRPFILKVDPTAYIF